MDPLEQLQRDWDLRIAQAPEDDRPALEIQKRDAIIAFQRHQSAERDREGWRQRALADNPQADPAALTGATEEEITRQAEASQKRFQDAFEAESTRIRAEAAETARQEAARQVYGGQQGGGVPQGGGAPNANDAEDAYFQKHLAKVRVALHDKGYYSPTGSRSDPLAPGDPVDVPAGEKLSAPAANAYIAWRMKKRFGIHAAERSAYHRITQQQGGQTGGPPANTIPGGGN